MPNNRPTAKEAIEALKIHQLRRENVVIFDEVKGLRTEVAVRQEELSKLQKLINTIQDDFKQICKSQSETKSSVQGLGDAIKSVLDDQEKLRQAQTDSKQYLVEGFAISKEACRKSEEFLSNVSEQLKQLRKKIDELEQTNIETVKQIRDELGGKADENAIVYLENKLHNLVQRIEEKVAAQETAINKIPDSINLLAECYPTQQSVVGSDASLWRPIGQIDTIQSNSQRIGDIVLGENIPQVGAQPQLEVEADTVPPARQPNAISNIAHEVQTPLEKASHVPPRPEIHMEVAQPSINLMNISIDMRIDWQFLQTLLTLKQQEKENILEYLERFKASFVRTTMSKDFIAILLRRFASGMLDSNCQTYFQQWLSKGQWTLNDAQDCAILLAACRDENVAICDVAASTQSKPPTDYSRRSNRIKDYQARSQGESGNNDFSCSGILRPDKGLASKSIVKPVATQQQAKKNVLKGNSASFIKEVLSPTKKRKVAGFRPRNQKGRFISQKEMAAGRQTATKLLASVDVTPPPQPTPIPRAPVRGSKKRKEVFGLPPDEMYTVSPEVLLSPNLPNRALRKRVPTLVPSDKKRRVVVSETSDSIGLPAAPIVKSPPKRQKQTETEEGQNFLGKKRKHRHDTPPEIPILQISTSDLEAG